MEAANTHDEEVVWTKEGLEAAGYAASEAGRIATRNLCNSLKGWRACYDRIKAEHEDVSVLLKTGFVRTARYYPPGVVCSTLAAMIELHPHKAEKIRANISNSSYADRCSV